MIEFGQLLAGPYVASLLGDFGADVVKVEAPPNGDPMREWGRHRHNGHTLWWPILSRNKRSVSLNLRTEEGQRIARELCAEADVVLENFKPGTMEKWGIGPEQVHERNPGCIYARVSGYGQTGRYRDRAGFASGGEAMAGLRYINGYPGQAPPRCGISLGDTLAAQSCFQGILLALYARDARGATGQVVDAAILDACFSMLESTVPEYDKCGVVREPSGTVLAKIAPSNVYLSSDEQVGRHRGQPRHPVPPPVRADGAAGARRRPALLDARARAASGWRSSTRSSASGRRSTRPRSSTASSTRRASCARRSTPSPTSSTTPTSASAACSWRCRIPSSAS